MLVLDPSKRYSVDNIKRHRWMVEEAPRLLPSTSSSTDEPNEQILRLMQSLGIDAIKTREVLKNFLLSLCYTKKWYNTYLHLLIVSFEFLSSQIKTLTIDSFSIQKL